MLFIIVNVIKLVGFYLGTVNRVSWRATHELLSRRPISRTLKH